MSLIVTLNKNSLSISIKCDCTESFLCLVSHFLIVTMNVIMLSFMTTVVLLILFRPYGYECKKPMKSAK